MNLGTPSKKQKRLVKSGVIFAADVGVDDEVGRHGSVVFQVWADAKKLYVSSAMYGSTATKHVNVSLVGKQELKLLLSNTQQ